MSENSPIIKLYKGFASKEVTYIHGHVLRSVSKQREKLTSNPLKNALEMYRRYKVSPMKRTQVQLQDELGNTHETKSDKRGYFTFQLKGGVQDDFNFQVSLKAKPEVACEGQVKGVNPEQIIVSDIDDTILISHATNLLKKLYLLLTKNHESRKAFEGIRSFYAQLSENKKTSFFYVSSSEWNLYDFLNDFIEFNQLPQGIFLLQDIKSGLLDLFKSGGGSHSHKRDKIERLIKAFPQASFILVGDSGQKDPYLYQEIAIRYPERIDSIYIRDVRSSKRSKVENVVNELDSKGIKMKLFADS